MLPRRRIEGNILFILLIAVVLLSALANAVVGSMNGGGKSASKEANAAMAAMLVNEMNRIKAAVDRLYLVGDYTQVHFNSSEPNNAGNVFGGPVLSSGKTIGVFHPSTGVSKPIYNAKTRDPAYESDTRFMEFYTERVSVNGIELGTEAADDVIRFTFLTPDLCAEINRNLWGVENLRSANAVVVPTYSYARMRVNTDGSELSTSPANTVTNGRDYPEMPGCFDNGLFYVVLKAR